ncbi:hypothetical protein LshimejAT787_0904920 [Lyophyllum shimeji]|uniref:Uncharacterized protein n=1 Tax=Lyophyllum shimeji TaxID=47721 RepID=A0A9P3UQH6_LYOSH|nr:hypothetical protein LshimejAT787_0904920 [Lyophyllum shimeji]
MHTNFLAPRQTRLQSSHLRKLVKNVMIFFCFHPKACCHRHRSLDSVRVLRSTCRPCSQPPCSPSHAHSHSRSWSPSGLIPQDFKLIDLEKGFQQEEPDSPCRCKTRSPQHLHASYLPVNALASPQTGCSLQFRAGQRRCHQLPNVYIICNALPSSIPRPLACRVNLGRPCVGAHVLLPSSDNRSIMETSRPGEWEGEGGSGELEHA